MNIADRKIGSRESKQNENLTTAEKSEENSLILEKIDLYNNAIAQDKNLEKDLIMYVEPRAISAENSQRGNESFELALYVQKHLLSDESTVSLLCIKGNAGS